MPLRSPDPEALLEEGLHLYSQGDFDGAIACWRAALDGDPDLSLALEYIHYVEDNRTALSQNFSAADPAAAIHLDDDEPLSSKEITAVEFSGVAAVRERSGVGDPFEEVAAGECVEAGGGRQRRRTSVSLQEGRRVALQDGHRGETLQPESRHHVAFAGGAIPVSTTPSSLDLPATGQGQQEAGAPQPEVQGEPAEHQGKRRPRPTARGLLSGKKRSSHGHVPEPEQAIAALSEEELVLEDVTPASMVRRRSQVAGPPPVPEEAVLSPLRDLTRLQLSAAPGGGFMDLGDLLTSEEESERLGEDASWERGLDRLSGSPKSHGVGGIAVSPTPLGEQIADIEEGEEERVDTMLLSAHQLQEQGTHEGSLWLCEKILAIEPDNSEARALLQRNKAVLLSEYEQMLGGLAVVPAVRIAPGEIVWHKLDHRAGFLLSRVDGMLTYDDILDIAGMERFEAMRILAQLVTQGVIGRDR